MAVSVSAWSERPRWPFASSNFLSGRELHVWRCDLTAHAAQLNSYWSTLSSDERERATRFRAGIHRRRYIVGRGVLRMLLGRYLQKNPEGFAFLTMSTASRVFRQCL